jgi:hypothetical protein
MYVCVSTSLGTRPGLNAAARMVLVWSMVIGPE